MRLRLIQNRLGVGRKPAIDEDPLCQLVMAMAGKSPNSTEVVCCWENHRSSLGGAPHLVGYNPSYRWINPTYPTYN